MGHRLGEAYPAEVASLLVTLGVPHVRWRQRGTLKWRAYLKVRVREAQPKPIPGPSAEARREAACVGGETRGEVNSGGLLQRTQPNKPRVVRQQRTRM